MDLIKRDPFKPLNFNLHSEVFKFSEILIWNCDNSERKYRDASPDFLVKRNNLDPNRQMPIGLKYLKTSSNKDL